MKLLPLKKFLRIFIEWMATNASVDEIWWDKTDELIERFVKEYKPGDYE